MRRGFLLPPSSAALPSSSRRRRNAGSASKTPPSPSFLPSPSPSPSSSPSSPSSRRETRRRDGGDVAPPPRPRRTTTATATRSRALLDLEGTDDAASRSIVSSTSSSTSPHRSSHPPPGLLLLLPPHHPPLDDDGGGRIRGGGKRAAVVVDRPEDCDDDDDCRPGARRMIVELVDRGGGGERISPVGEKADDGDDDSDRVVVTPTPAAPAPSPPERRRILLALHDDGDEDDDDDNDDDDNDLARFANDASLALARLRGRVGAPDECGGGGGNGGRMKAEATVRSFAARHFPDASSLSPMRRRRRLRRRLDVLWGATLGPIAVDCYQRRAGGKKGGTKEGRSGKSSPALALASGVIEYLAAFPPGRGAGPEVAAAYECLADALSDASRFAAPREGGDDDEGNARDRDGGGLGDRPKISALGAVCLVRCRIRRIGAALTKLECRGGGSGCGGTLTAGSSPPPFVGPSRAGDDCGEGTGAGSSKARNDYDYDRARGELDTLLATVSSPLGDIATNDGDGERGRTVLRSAASDAFFELVEMSSRALVHERSGLRPWRDDVTDTVRIWKDVLQLVERVLAVNRRWASTDEGGERCRSSDGGIRLKCAKAVFTDWSDVVRTSRRLFFDRFVGNDLRDVGADHSAESDLFWNLSGISLTCPGRGDSLEGAIFRVGGISQSLCHDRECVLSAPIGSLSRDKGGSNVRAEDLVSSLREAAGLTEGIRRARRNAKLSEMWMKENHQRAAVRAFASWISMGSKAIRVLTKNKKCPENEFDLLDDSMSSLVMLLRSESKQCVAMSIATL